MLLFKTTFRCYQFCGGNESNEVEKAKCCVPLQNLKCHPKMVIGIQIPQQGLSRKVHLDQD